MENNKQKILINDINSIVNEYALQCENVFAERAKYISWVLSEFNLLFTEENINSAENEILFSHLQNFHDKLEKELKNELTRVHTNKLDELLNSLRLQLKDVLKEQDPVIIVLQESNHFNSQGNDGILVKAIKPFKRSVFNIDRMFRKNKSEYSWKRKVRYKNIFSYYYEISLIKNILSESERQNEKYGQALIDLIAALKKVDATLLSERMEFEINQKDTESFIETLSSFKEAINEIIIEQKEVFNQFNQTIAVQLIDHGEKVNNELAVSGTLASRNKSFSNDTLDKLQLQLKKKIDASKETYKNYFDSVFDRIEFYTDWMWFTYLMLKKYLQTKRIVSEYSDKNINILFDEVNALFSSAQSNILSGNGNLLAVLEKEKNKLFVEIDKKLTDKIISTINENGLISNLTKFHEDLERDLNDFAREYLFVSQSNLDYNIDSDHIKKFSPKNIISTTVLAKLDDVITEATDEYSHKVNKLGTKIIGVGRVVEFNISSAINKIKEKNTTEDECKKIAVSGIERAGNKSDELLEEYNTIITETYSILDKSLKNILKTLFSYTNVEQLLTVKLRLSKEKALRELKENTTKYLFQTNAFIRLLSTKTSGAYQIVKNKVGRFTSRVGLTQVPAEQGENYTTSLLKSNEIFNNLPYVYQQLFSNEQLFDERIFVGREKEREKLLNAYNYWSTNRIGSAVIVGEKGSGTSSLINNTMMEFNSNYTLYRKEFNRTVHTKEELETILSKLLKFDETITLEDITKRLNSSERRVIVIIENLEDFFLRVINGFEVLKLMFDLISKTQSNVFWIATCNLYAWNYLVNVININDYFSFIVKLNQLNVELTKEIILKRHNISGYDLEFAVPEDVVKQKSYIKLDDKGKHEFLQEMYFEKLMKLSSDNIAIALFLWLRSIKEIDDERILITSKISIDTSYLKNLSDDKIFTLLQLILHDGLSLHEHSLINNCSTEKSNLLLMALKDDGIIFVRNDRYKVNFQLYRPVVNLLKSKNILY